LRNDGRDALCAGAADARGGGELKELVVALLGAVTAGLLQWIVALLRRKAEDRAILAALVAEVQAICKMLRAVGYAELYNDLHQRIKEKTWDGTSYVIDFRSGYFSVFEALASSLGRVSPQYSKKIVFFYVLCKTAVDSSRPDGPARNDSSQESILAMATLLQEILKYGDEISQLTSSAKATVIK
jgi:hypothetical protein